MLWAPPWGLNLGGPGGGPLHHGTTEDVVCSWTGVGPDGGERPCPATPLPAGGSCQPLVPRHSPPLISFPTFRSPFATAGAATYTHAPAAVPSAPRTTSRATRS